MKVAIVRFPGSNCDADALHALRRDVGVDADYVWQTETSLAGFDAVWVPGGFSYGDYLRCGAMAARAPIMSAVRDFAGRGGLVIGVCNGFQVLCESGLLPGALVRNVKQRFICQDVQLEPATRRGPWMAGVDRTITLPIAHGEGRFVCAPETLKELQDNDQIAFRYASENVNGSTEAIAGVMNAAGNVLGLMPHPERATRDLVGGTDGLLLLQALKMVRTG
ncbi:MAG TPA: phosphoribosylformylglycinamidine synthase subunit PurQ [Fimbriimonadaceae bacterium]|nr:phosphoribosylformylglycinamidine synthase subunit PurQ [Armatimonadota bacterium]HCM74604.1 phosphoribosylformylglycinamidine synthase subunit PurQ [Armatimonadota bacterium]HRD30404.1 phosphoribosylformylglycinamidine synthase subunit PurQ [Fimbriimonadaceae bacterium]HRE92937.1 phosphoribosylformylglycinamidine synthase subunit PurQ [Fimbriimonadaceae bacterium]HRI73667.1 phosphoribosylformylglycinamidine synthase subunit PurQ [Fimbriimonadaceae bacterium]